MEKITEESSRMLEINDLFNLLEQRKKELADSVNKPEGHYKIQWLKEDVELLQRIIIAKRAEHKPG